MSRIKICGLKRSEDICMVNEVKPDYAGFVIEFPKSHRSLTREQLRCLTRELDSEITSVGVFVDAEVHLVAELLEEGSIDMAQLHGQEDENYIRQLRKLTDKPISKAFLVRSSQDIEQACKSTADYILLDQGYGSGQTFDWNLIPPIGRPWFLAGGLSADNLRQAIRQINPWAVDLSSSLEVDGCKDAGKIREVMDIIRE